MPKAPIQVRALVRPLSTEQGGRAAPISGPWRPNDNFFGADNREMAMGLMDVPEADPLAPGEERLTDIRFIAWPDGLEFAPGREWRIQEGAQLVGRGKIVSVG